GRVDVGVGGVDGCPRHPPDPAPRYAAVLARDPQDLDLAGERGVDLDQLAEVRTDVAVARHWDIELPAEQIEGRVQVLVQHVGGHRDRPAGLDRARGEVQRI